jgi:hypothetical protein
MLCGMASLFALLLMTATPEAAAAPPPAPQARAIGVARARILSPIRVSADGPRALGQQTDPRAPQLSTHSQPRRDGARVIDCY